MIRKLTIAAVVLALSGCQTAQEMFAHQKPVTADMKAQIVAGARDVLKDPYSIRDAEISYSVPAQGGGTFVCVKANAKNGMGGYTGRKGWLIPFNKAGRIMNAFEGHPFCNYTEIKYQPFPEIYKLRNI
ncbi:hypothetical protein [Sinorhizobium meliloti]|uniref:hypothetical protein n=1 Tax=Rhizobium meliloti TaxID=382 RepID=UPI000FDA9386|nr:hypothetical protein [Sinorhizobium meliloti]RVG25055.1 hypothetical protein CN229_24105 [Sinorhizobium meliloti]